MSISLTFLFSISQGLPGASSMKSIPYPSSGPSGRGQVANRLSSGAVPEGADQYIGKRVKTRWPDDNHFYEAVITDFNPIEVFIIIDFQHICFQQVI
jgi:hypothetical protein